MSLVMAHRMLELIVTLFFVYKVVVFIVSATCIFPICLSTMFSFFHMENQGWHLDIPLQDAHGRPHHSKKVTQLLWHAYRFHVRPLEVEPSNLSKDGILFQQLVCDAWASIDQCNLTWASNNQTTLRADLYQGLRDRMNEDAAGENLAQVGCVILPSTHKDSTHYMQQLPQDSLATCHKYKKPDLLLTMTANGSWPEITQNLLPGICIKCTALHV